MDAEAARVTVRGNTDINPVVAWVIVLGNTDVHLVGA